MSLIELGNFVIDEVGAGGGVTSWVIASSSAGSVVSDVKALVMR